MSITVLLIDDSVVVRQVLTDLINSEPGLEVMGSAADPFEAVYILKEKVPDVIVLDVEMPRMDGITFLRKLMTQHPIPVVMCSSVTKEGSHATLKALEYGAVDIIQKPRIGVHKFLQESRTQICDAIKAASLVSVKAIRSRPPTPQKTSSHAAIYKSAPAKTLSRHQYRRTRKIITIGASTGGTRALERLLKEMPEDSPGTLIVQHMPEHFTKAFSDRLNSVCPMDIKEAEHGDEVLQGRVLIAPGGDHMTLRSGGMQKFYVDIKKGPLVSRHRPSVDQLFHSVARCSGHFIGVILTGMGSDGANGMHAMKNNGAITIAQDEKSCVVFGMPQEAIKLGSVDQVLPLNQIAPELVKLSFSRT